MAKLFDEIDDSLRAFIEAQPMFFVATAPSGDGGHVNLSPKGGRNLFRVTGPLGFAYVDLMGSGIETIAHLRENGRVVVMFCAFEGPPKIVRLHGVGRPVQQQDEGFPELLASFEVSDEQRPAVRSVVTVEVTRVADSCGFVVPRMDYVGERDQLYRFADNRIRKLGSEAVAEYVSENNAQQPRWVGRPRSAGVDQRRPRRRRPQALTAYTPAHTQLRAPEPPAHSAAARRSCSAFGAWYACRVEPPRPFQVAGSIW